LEYSHHSLKWKVGKVECMMTVVAIRQGVKGEAFRRLTGEEKSPAEALVFLFEDLDLTWYSHQLEQAIQLYNSGADIVEMTETLGRTNRDGQYETVILLLHLLYKGKIKDRSQGFLGEFAKIGGAYYPKNSGGSGSGNNNALPIDRAGDGKGACA